MIIRKIISEYNLYFSVIFYGHAGPNKGMHNGIEIVGTNVV